jgi:L-fucose isomerase-like protein
MCGTGTRQAQIHSNRKMPLLFQFPLKPGRVTLARVSQARGQQFLAIAGGEVLDRPMSFTGTSGVVRTDTPAELFSGRLIASGLEHHLALAYGDHRADLISAAAALGLPVLEL